MLLIREEMPVQFPIHPLLNMWIRKYRARYRRDFASGPSLPPRQFLLLDFLDQPLSWEGS